MSTIAPEPAPPADLGSAERFDRLYRDTRDDLYAYVATLLRDRDAAEDVTALAFERAFRKRRSFDRARGEARAWLFGIARNAALDELRRRQRAGVVSGGLPDDGGSLGGGPEASVQDAVEAVLQRSVVRAALVRIPARDREVLALKYHAGLTNPEIARVLGVSETNVSTLVHRALEKLRRAFDAAV